MELLSSCALANASFTIKLFPQISATKSNSQKTHLKKQIQILDELTRLAAHKEKLQQCNLGERAQDLCSSQFYPFQAFFSKPLNSSMLWLRRRVSSTSLLHKSTVQPTGGKYCTCNRTSLFSSKSLRLEKGIKELCVKWDSCSRAPFWESTLYFFMRQHKMFYPSP